MKIEFSPAFGEIPNDLAERQAEEARLLALYERPSNLKVTNITIPGSEAQIPARLYQPLDDNGNQLVGPLPLFIWFHGGAFVFGDIDMGEAEFTSCEVAARAGAVVVSVDYRLANPAQRFPVCQVDALDAVLWARENASSMGADPERFFVGGASAGACLSGSVGLMLRDRGIEAKGILPIYPVAHATLPEMNDVVRAAVEGVFFFTTEFSRLHNGWLLEADPNYDPLSDKFHVFPGDSGDVSGQAPFLVVHAERDSLRASGELWTAQLRAAGVSVEEHIELNQMHGYLSDGPTNPGMDRTTNLMVGFIKSRS